MVKRIGSIRRKTRHKLSKKPREKGKISLSRYFQEFKKDEKVVLVAEPGVHKGTYHPRYYGKSGIVQKKEGTCYVVMVKDQGKQKALAIHPVHLKKVTGEKNDTKI